MLYISLYYRDEFPDIFTKNLTFFPWLDFIHFHVSNGKEVLQDLNLNCYWLNHTCATQQQSKLDNLLLFMFVIGGNSNLCLYLCWTLTAKNVSYMKLFWFNLLAEIYIFSQLLPVVLNNRQNKYMHNTWVHAASGQAVCYMFSL